MMTTEQIKKQLKDKNLRRVAMSADVSYITLWRLCSGNGNPSAAFVEKLSEYLEGLEGQK